ncbi:sulfur carrier protein ThiS [Chryseobacterium soli]|uniref:sulfur carrier protein ThiS n=1 Tax=Chryseobacterium soli TaxID=445961 RepID=UPI00295463A5|nr:sulfur carrier protein ThiS [Chryseobacterium soli]MDV7696413.1 sulfur carrier protein ThiS [Chryseobacterium soli]
MELTINHTTKTFDQLPENLEGLMAMEVPELKKGIAVAVNNSIVPKPSWPDTLLKDKDSILIITATQGG